ncbi:MAG TPA: GGDEF domain-containing protein [Mycobacteriales bacterium]|nr:GGDEF domain-containing protein [Mycobacteriales bacterium]
MNRTTQHSSEAAELLEGLQDLVLTAEAHAPSAQPARLERAVRRWSQGVASPSDAVVVVAMALRESAGSPRQLELLEQVAVLAVAAIAERQVTEALVDPLTGLATRSRMQDEGEHLLAVSRRTGSPMTAVVLDVDGLKLINDVQGHAAGDAAIAEVGRAVREHLRRADRAFRWGGDEFVLFLSGTTTQEARVVVDRIQRSCATPTSVGIATHDLHDGDGDVAAWLAAADADLYGRRSAVRAVLAPPPARRRRPLLAGARSAILLGTLALGAALLGWTGATLTAGSGTAVTAGPAVVVPPAAPLPSVVRAPDASARVATPVTSAPSRVVTVVRSVSRPAPAGAAAVVPAEVPAAAVPLPSDELPVSPPDAPGVLGLVGGLVDRVGGLLSFS